MEGVRIWEVIPEQLDEELVTIELALEGIEDDVKDSVRVQVEVADDRTNDLDRRWRLTVSWQTQALGHIQMLMIIR